MLLPTRSTKRARAVDDELARVRRSALAQKKPRRSSSIASLAEGALEHRLGRDAPRISEWRGSV